jgi:hypothetical protein
MGRVMTGRDFSNKSYEKRQQVQILQGLSTKTENTMASQLYIVSLKKKVNLTDKPTNKQVITCKVTSIVLLLKKTGIRTSLIPSCIKFKLSEIN